VAWMDDEALHRTLTTGRATYWSRSREEYWVKGETSGHVQRVQEVRLDCDGDALLVVVDQTGPACHTGTHSCFDADVLLAANGCRRRSGRQGGLHAVEDDPQPQRELRVEVVGLDLGVRRQRRRVLAQVLLHPRADRGVLVRVADRAPP